MEGAGTRQAQGVAQMKELELVIIVASIPRHVRGGLCWLRVCLRRCLRGQQQRMISAQRPITAPSASLRRALPSTSRDLPRASRTAAAALV